MEDENAYVTVKLFREVVAEFRAEFRSVRMDISGLKTQMKSVQGFIKHVSTGIEHEISAYLKDWVKETYPRMVWKESPFTNIRDSTGGLITDLDAASFVIPYAYEPDYGLAKRIGATFMPTPMTPEISGAIFILAEVKHHITPADIQQKLFQFDRMLRMFDDARRVAEGDKNYPHRFLQIVRASPFLANVVDAILFFGATVWEKDLRNRLTQATTSRRHLNVRFGRATGAEKQTLYEKIRSIDESWYTPLAPRASPEEITTMSYVDGALGRTRMIVPTGHRFTTMEMVMMLEPMHGGRRRKTRKVDSYRVKPAKLTGAVKPPPLIAR